MKLIIELPDNYLDAADVDSLDWMFKESSRLIENKLQDAIVADQLKRYAAQQPKVSISPAEVKDRMLTILAERALEAHDD